MTRHIERAYKRMLRRWTRGAEVIDQGVRFGLAGGTVTLVYLGVTTMLADVAGLPFQAALAVGFSVALIVHFTLQRMFVWADREEFALPLRHQAGRYLVLAAVQYGVTAASTSLLPPTLGVSTEIVYLATVVVVISTNFLVFRHRIFHGKPAAVEPAPDSLVESPRVGVLGLWHLGCVTAACLAERGFDVVGADPDSKVVSELRSNRLPVAEPGLGELLSEGQHSGRLRFDSLDGGSLNNVDILWITFDTPVDDEDRADSDWVIQHAHQALRHAAQGALVVVSSQLPVGSTARLAALLDADGRGDLHFACVPENLRIGHALSSFRSPERIVAGVRDAVDRDRLAILLAPFTDHVEWMGVESAEMTKHALNGFLASSVTFINEIASLCECVGANAAEVSRGLKSDLRIGPRSYLSPGDVFAGGTLARDVSTLNQLARDHNLPAHLMSGIAASNQAHNGWARRAISELLGAEEADAKLRGKHFAVWGLTYKPGTDTLRRSSALELCCWLCEQGAIVRAHDPAITAVPGGEESGIELCATPLSAAQEADALVVCTAWPEYRQVGPQELISTMSTPIVLDAGGHVQATFGSDPAIQYVRVGTRTR